MRARRDECNERAATKWLTVDGDGLAAALKCRLAFNATYLVKYNIYLCVYACKNNNYNLFETECHRSRQSADHKQHGNGALVQMQLTNAKLAG